ncbi:MAG: type II secretion system F family protein [Lachnospiraceae bacterium]|nr:type II secretion system F family protein [Lachnospiraceae bacterium]
MKDKLVSKRVRDDLKTLYPTDQAGRQVKKYYRNKMTIVLALFLLGFCFMLMSFVSSRTSKKTIDPLEEEAVSENATEDKEGLKLFALCVAAGMGYYFYADYDLHQKTLKKKDDLVEAYPDWVSKLALLLQAGMPMKAAWFKLAKEYDKEGDFNLAQEMLLTCHEMEEGVSELRAYSNFGKRCGHSRYLRFSAMITQNLRRGSAGILERMAKEAKETLEERKHLAKRKGEAIATKLLIPMMLMLVIVMVIIMVPAFIGI